MKAHALSALVITYDSLNILFVYTPTFNIDIISHILPYSVCWWLFFCFSSHLITSSGEKSQRWIPSVVRRPFFLSYLFARRILFLPFIISLGYQRLKPPGIKALLTLLLVRWFLFLNECVGRWRHTSYGFNIFICKYNNTGLVNGLDVFPSLILWHKGALAQKMGTPSRLLTWHKGVVLATTLPCAGKPSPSTFVKLDP